MKKTIAKILSVILTVTAVLTVFVGCDWITTNSDRDMAQVIATVQINDKVEAENIYKRQMVAGYLGYAYQYVYYYGYTQAKAYEIVLDNLVNNRIVVQQARIELADLYNDLLNKNGKNDFENYYKESATAKGTAIDPKKGDVENLKQYLSEYEIANSYYSVRKNINAMIDDYVKNDDTTEEKEDVSYTARTTPEVKDEGELTESQLKEKVPTEHDYEVANLTLKITGDNYLKKLGEVYTNVYDLNMAVWAEYKIDISTAARRKAYGSMLQALRDQKLIKSNETYDYAADTDNVLKYTYFGDILKSQLENALVEKYEDSLIDEVTLSDDAVWAQYKEDYKAQKALYMNDYSAYESALSSASDTKFALYNPFEGYGYVANLLIGFTSEQSNLLSEYSSKAGVSKEDIENYRAELAKQLYAKDQRDSWVYLNYFDLGENGQATIKDEYRLSDLENIKNFVGDVEIADPAGYTEEDDDGVTVTKWKVNNVSATPIAFEDFVETYLGEMGMGLCRYEVEGEKYGIIQNYDQKETLNKFRDLMFAFNTDAGGLSYEYGYVYSPITSATQYVPEFAAAAALVVDKGVGAYTMVITDYGIHVILCTKLVTEPYAVSDDPENEEAEKQAFLADIQNEDSIAYKYRKVKLDNVTQDVIGKKVNKFVNTYRENNVTYFENTYSDLMEDSSEA